MMIPLNDKTARELSTRVAKQSHGVVVKFGRTNGNPVLHLVRKMTDKVDAASVTIHTEADWAEHEWNTHNKPREKRETGLIEAIANKEAQ